MNSENPLTQLHDIVEQQSVSWWPLAWGWWLIIVLLILVVAWLVLRLQRRRVFLQTQKQCISMAHTATSIAGVSSALRIAIKHYYPTHTSLSNATGATLLTSMNKQLPAAQQIPPQEASAMGHALYSPDSASYLERYRDFTLAWLNQCIPASAQQSKGGQR